MELWDLLDKNGNSLGITHVRGQKLPEGTYHRTVDIITINSQSEMLITLRDPCKEIYPDLWETTGGSAVAGEDSMAAAIRELHEETGILVSENDMIFLKTILGKTALSDVYMTFNDSEISELTLQKGETVAAKWVTFDEFEAMAHQKIIAEPVFKRYLEVKNLILSRIAER